MRFFSLGIVNEFAKCEGNYESVFKKVYSPLLSALFGNSSLRCSFAFSGPQLEWLLRRHEEFIHALKALISKNQVEVLTGGYYEPFFAFLRPSDITGQIEKMTTLIRKTFGKRPVGIYLKSSAWSPALPAIFSQMGIKYAFLEKNLAKNSFPFGDGILPPAVAEERGKSCAVFFFEKNSLASFSRPLSEDETRCAFFSDEFLAENFEEFSKGISECGEVFSNVLSHFRNSEFDFQNACIPAGIESEKAEKMRNAFLNKEYRPSVRDFSQFFPEIMQMRARIEHSISLANQIKGDKTRKKLAIEEIWKSQDGRFFDPFESALKKSDRKIFFKNIFAAEKMIPKKNIPPNGISAQNFAGNVYFFARADNFSAVISKEGGSVCELDFPQASQNYASAAVFHDANGKNFYARRLFCDHFFEESDASVKERFESGKFSSDLARQKYALASQTTREICLCAKLNNGIFLTKRYLLNDKSFSVQYILRNESGEKISGYFACENNFSLLSDGFEKAQISFVSQGINLTFTPKSDEKRTFDEISYVQINDSNKAKFVLEMNENAQVSVLPLFESENGGFAAATILTYWRVSLEKGSEAERSIALMVQDAK